MFSINCECNAEIHGFMGITKGNEKVSLGVFQKEVEMKIKTSHHINVDHIELR